MKSKIKHLTLGNKVYSRNIKKISEKKCHYFKQIAYRMILNR